MRRPDSIAEAAEWSRDATEFRYHFADFLHEFAARPNAGMLRERPGLLRETFPEGEICDAYLAAAAATLAARIGEPAPSWTWESERFLKRPWFASNGASMRACLLLESPARFRERNLFVAANVLSIA